MIKCRIKFHLKADGRRFKFSFCLFVVLLSCLYASGQDQGPVMEPDKCRKVIADAEMFFQDGLYDNSVELLERVLHDCEISGKEREHAMEILAKSYVELHDPGRAVSVVEAMLKKYPHYELNENENFEAYNRLVKKYRVHPLFSLGVRNTGLWTRFHTSRVHTLPDGPDNTALYNNEGYVFMYYGWAEVEFGKGISLNGDLVWWTARYDRDVVREPDIDLHYLEWLEFVEIPLYLKKYFNTGSNIMPYAAAGLGWFCMTKSKGNINNYNSLNDVASSYNDIQMMPMRNKNTFEWLIGAGIGYKIKNLRFFGDIRYYRGINSITDPAHRLDNRILSEEFLYVDNEVKLNKFEIGVSISYTFINSVKRISHLK
jgi:hypothetical protein